MRKIVLIVFCWLLAAGTVLAQQKSKSEAAELPATTWVAPEGVQVVTTQHQVKVAGKTIAYLAHAGHLLVNNDTGKVLAKIFFTYYQKTGEAPDNRPVTFTFNGGPGSSSIWLHMGGLGPRRVKLDAEGYAQGPPYAIVDNEFSWLDKTDLVFIDPVSTGLSRPAAGESAKQFHGYVEDVQAMGMFVRQFLSRYQRWSSPKFLAGESYGTTRAAGLSKFLQDRYRIYINGIFLISAVLNFGTNDYYVGNDLPRALYIPSYAAAAWYHKKLAPEYQASLDKTLKAAEDFALGDYATALLKGGWLAAEEKDRIAARMSALTGLSKTYILQSNLRVTEDKFYKELRRTDGLTIGRLDARFTGRDLDDAGESVSFDPSFANIDGPFTSALNDYLDRELQVKDRNGYNVFGDVYPWNYNNVQNQFLNVAESLRDAMAKNPALKVYLGCGYYDFATPYFTAHYDLEHMFLRPEQRKNVQVYNYPAGHMYYIHQPSLVQFKKDVDAFFAFALKP